MLCTHHLCVLHDLREQKRCWVTLELELQLCTTMWVLGTESNLQER